MSVLTRLLGFLDRRAPAMLAGGLVLGFAWPALAALLRPALQPIVFALAVAATMRVEGSALEAHLRRPAVILAIVAWLLLVSPILTALVLAPLEVPAGLAQAIVVWSASPPLISAPALAALVGLDSALALVAMIASSAAMPLLLPPLILGLLGIPLPIGIVGLMLRLLGFIGGAVLVAMLLRRGIGAARIAAGGRILDRINLALLVLFAVAVMDGVSERAATRPRELVLYAAAAFAASLGQQAAATLAFLRRGRGAALTIGMSAANRNVAAVWASLGALATPELTLLLLMAQLPIYLLPALLRPVYRRLKTVGGPR